MKTESRYHWTGAIRKIGEGFEMTVSCGPYFGRSNEIRFVADIDKMSMQFSGGCVVTVIACAKDKKTRWSMPQYATHVVGPTGELVWIPSLNARSAEEFVLKTCAMGITRKT